MATRIIGNIEQLTTKTHSIREWFERFDSFVAANQLFVAVPELQAENANAQAVATAHKANTATFLAYCSGDVYSTLKSLLNPALPQAKTVDQLKELLKVVIPM